ncbi:MAG: DegT/DnrJ/EryC1/StrS family aminotransferase [Candidatus Methanofastidiosum sp.]|nr:DegT/DnrJ/EryC1/StrS family aminotransferase [Methanofastidiosum sp.]
MGWRIPLFKIFWDQEDVNSITEAIKLGMYWTEGPNVENFEKRISEYIGAKYCVTFNSGTSALHSSLLSYDIKNGDEVIVPSFTFIATANAPLFVGAKPVFADIEEDTFGLNPEDVNEKITDKTKAIIPVHYGGCPCNIKALKEIAEDNKLILIEDAAEAFGARIKKQKIGTFGDSSMFSFCQNKIITTGEGGAITTNSKDIYNKLKLIHSQGRSEIKDYFFSTNTADYVSLGYNFRMSNIIASLGISQISKADKLIEQRRDNSKYLTSKLKDYNVKFINPPKDYFNVYQLYTIRVDKTLRDKLMGYLEKKGIMTKIYFFPVHKTHFYRDVLGYKCNLEITENLSEEVLTLPMFPSLEKLYMDIISREIKNFFKEIE